jgi:hypothetical protein
VDHGSGRLGVHVRCIEVASLTLYHPMVPSDGGIRVPQLGAERLDLSLNGQPMGAELHRHVLVVYHIHSRDILHHPEAFNLSFFH